MGFAMSKSLKPQQPWRPNIAMVGSGGVGSYIGGKLALDGHQVTLIDAWPAHIEAIRATGLIIADLDNEVTVKPRTMHISDVQTLCREPLDLAFICVKLYDTRWATELIAPYVKEGGIIVTLQNGLVEDEVAAIAGHSRTLGAIGSTMSVCLSGPGKVVRMQAPAGDTATVFYVGELQGAVTPRVSAVTNLLAAVDSSKAIDNLIGERWAKLVANTMSGGLAALSGLTFRQLYETPRARRVAIRLAGEAIRVGRALGYSIEAIRGVAPDLLLNAADGDASALSCVESYFCEVQRKRPDNGRPAMAADLAAGRRTEVDELSGLVVRQAKSVGLEAPTHALVVRIIHAIEAGDAVPSERLLERCEQSGAEGELS